MRTQSEEAKMYAELTYKLAEQYEHDRHRYTDEKSPFIWQIIMRKADAWDQANRLDPRPIRRVKPPYRN